MLLGYRVVNRMSLRRIKNERETDLRSRREETELSTDTTFYRSCILGKKMRESWKEQGGLQSSPPKQISSPSSSWEAALLKGLKRGQQAYLSSIMRIYDSQHLRENLRQQYVFNLQNQWRLGYITKEEVVNRTVFLDRSLTPKRGLSKKASSNSRKPQSAFPIWTFKKPVAVQEGADHRSPDSGNEKTLMPGGRK
ncbi:protein FAM216B [Tachyglossus aculeatus]|uniref:protein FAM216B n=1 Tax=Tachyglossus aculeatus TaxID=9261 RepID=UPI0018F6AB22|nr:protein FAM216B [Tachyglossus aculeatus]